MIKFYGSPMSSSGRSHWMLEEVGVPYEYTVVKLREGGARTPEYKALNPFAKVPLLVDGELKIAESMAINFYLAEKYKPSLFPSDYDQRAHVLQWSFWAITAVQPEALTVMSHTMFLPESERNPKLAEAAREKLATFMDILEHALTQDYLVANRFTLADLNLGSIVNLAASVKAVTDQHPRVTAWLERLRARPAYQKAVAAAGG